MTEILVTLALGPRLALPSELQRAKVLKLDLRCGLKPYCKEQKIREQEF